MGWDNGGGVGKVDEMEKTLRTELDLIEAVGLKATKILMRVNNDWI